MIRALSLIGITYDRVVHNPRLFHNRASGDQDSGKGADSDFRGDALSDRPDSIHYSYCYYCPRSAECL